MTDRMGGFLGQTPAFGRLRDLTVKWRWPLLIIGAVLMGLCVIFPQIGLLEWVVLTPALLVILTRTADPRVKYRHLYGMGFVFFEAYYLVNFHWFLYMYPMDFAGLSHAASAVVVGFAWLGLSAFQAVGAALIFPLMGLAVRGKYLSGHPFLHPFLFSALWTALEWWQANSGWSGVPWGRLPLGQAELLPALQSASLFGSYFVTFLLLAVNGMLAYLLLHPSRRILCAAVAGGMFFGNLGVGMVCMSAYEDEGDSVTVAAIQGNLSSHDKWGTNAMAICKATYAELTMEAVEAGVELIVWPETAIPADIDRFQSLQDYLSELSREAGVTILAGVFTDGEDESDGDRKYNSIVAYLPDGTRHESVYNKRNPVPFGEFVPWRDVVMTLVPPLAEIGMLDDDLLVGDEAAVFDLSTGTAFDAVGGKVGSLICFDSIYEGNALDSVREGAELLAVSTNDSWFKDSRGVWMHNAQSQLRAIETGRYVVRAANTGVSSIISPTGEVTESLGALEKGYVISEVYLCDHTTLYTVIGNLFAYLCISFCAAWVLLPAGDRIVNSILSKKPPKKE